jgi:hypothetical protein
MTNDLFSDYVSGTEDVISSLRLLIDDSKNDLKEITKKDPENEHAKYLGSRLETMLLVLKEHENFFEEPE